MHQHLPIFASLILAAALASTSEAKADGNDRFWSGISPSFSAAPQHERSSYHERPSYHEHPSYHERSSYHEREHASNREPSSYRERHQQKTAKGSPAPAEKTAAASIADGKGRAYDHASKSWFDGDGQCWRGSDAFSYQHRAWFYGAGRWEEVDGHWQASAASGPTPVDCRTIPVFAAKLKPAPEQTTAGGSLTLNMQEGGRPSLEETAPTLPLRGAESSAVGVTSLEGTEVPSNRTAEPKRPEH